MSSPDTLRAALALLTRPRPERANTTDPTLERFSPQERRRFRTQLDTSRAWQLGSKRNLVALGISEKLAAAGATGELALTVYVKKKLPAEELGPAQIIPTELELEGLGERVLTDVREIGTLRLESLTTMVRPVVGGYSIGRAEQGITGTLGCLVTKRGDASRQLILSNSHVFARSGLGQPGDPIYQPGPDDATTPTDAIAKLDSWRPFSFADAYDNHIDAALAEPLDQETFAPEIFEIGRPKGVRSAQRGMMVQKTGRTTEHTWGRVQDVDFHTSIRYPRPGGDGYGAVKFGNLVVCSRYTESGDSGALVLDADGYAVGLHFCGTPTVSIFSQIHYVLDELDIDLVT